VIYIFHEANIPLWVTHSCNYVGGSGFSPPGNAPPLQQILTFSPGRHRKTSEFFTMYDTNKPGEIQCVLHYLFVKVSDVLQEAPVDNEEQNGKARYMCMPRKAYITVDIVGS
jgi:hypothetical protein